MPRKRKNKDEKLLQGATEENALKITPILLGYKYEADNNRKGGLNPRDAKWEENLDLYWNRADFSKKATWQARESLPEVSSFVDRFAAAVKDALITGPNGFYSVEDPADTEYDVCDAIKAMTDVWLGTCGKNMTGTCLDFTTVFEEQVKLGAMMACCATVGWKEDVPGGRVAIETVDPRKVWLDHTYNNLYRIRQQQIDKHELKDMAIRKDGSGKSIYNLQAIDQLVQGIALDAQREAEQASGTGAQITSTRQPVTIDEYVATVVAADGTVLAKDALMVVANDKYLIRGPEKNPYMHGKDWLVYSPLVVAPLSVYGRTYMEDFGSIARTFNNLTNLILDAVQVSAMKVWAVVPAMLTNPESLSSGIYPNKMFQLEEGADPKTFMNALDMGTLSADAVTVWQSIKTELREAADVNEIGLGQFAPKGRTSATEVSTTMESSSALIRSIAQTIEGRFLNPILNLTWQTGLQFAKKDDPMLGRAAGMELYNALVAQKAELLKRPVTFQANGISMLIQKQRMIKSLLQLTQYMAQDQQLLAAFMQKVDLEKYIKLLFHLSDINLDKISVSERQRLMQQVGQPLQQAAQAAGPPPEPGGAPAQQANQMTQALGVAQ